jgi:hypothetical protein
MEFIAKPSPYPYAKLLRATGPVRDSCFCEDSSGTCCPRARWGCHRAGGRNGEPQASLLRRMPPPSFRPHAVIDDVCDLPGCSTPSRRVPRGGRCGRGARPAATPHQTEERNDGRGSESRYWRRGRRKKAAEPETGAAAEAPSAAEGPGAGGSRGPGRPGGKVAAGRLRTAVAAFAAEDGTEGAETRPSRCRRRSVGRAESGARKKPRRRGRRRRKPSEGAAPQAADAIVPPPGADVPDEARRTRSKSRRRRSGT